MVSPWWRGCWLFRCKCMRVFVLNIEMVIIQMCFKANSSLKSPYIFYSCLMSVPLFQWSQGVVSMGVLSRYSLVMGVVLHIKDWESDLLPSFLFCQKKGNLRLGQKNQCTISVYLQIQIFDGTGDEALPCISTFSQNSTSLINFLWSSLAGCFYRLFDCNRGNEKGELFFHLKCQLDKKFDP